MDDTVIPVVLMHPSSARIVEIGDRLATGHPDLSVIGILDDLEALRSTPHVARAIVVTDSTAPDGQPVVDRVRIIRELGARVVVLSGNDFPVGVVPAMAAGADAVLPPDSSVRRIVEQVRLVANRARLMNEKN